MKFLKVLFLFVILFLTACSSAADITPLPTTIVEQNTSENFASSTNIRANGILLPIQKMELSFGTGGFIEAVEVGVGESVSAGQPLAHLDTSEATFALQQAEAALATAQANYDLVTAGTPVEQQAAISTANLDLIIAQQALADIYADADLKAAQARQTLAEVQKKFADNQRYLDSLTASANQAYTDAAYANMILAKANLDKAEEAYEPWRNKPENNTTRATMLSKLAEAQQIYDAAVRKYNGFSGSVNEIDLAQAEANLALAQAQFTDAQETYEILKDGPDPAEIALAETQIASAQAWLNLAEMGGPTTEQLALAQAQVDAARINLKIIQSQIDKMVITAPFDGLTSVVSANQGEWASPGEMMVEVMDTSHWKIETKNVGELQIGQIEVGQEVQVWVNAFKDEALTGQIVAISPIAIVQQGDTTYTLTIVLAPTDLNLWPWMTAQVEIVIE